MKSLFPDEPDTPQSQPSSQGYVLTRGAKSIQPDNPAAELIRRKLDLLYEDEPSATEEVEQVATIKPQSAMSKHQRYMHSLSTSGKSLAEIQQAWHAYYESLPDHEKHEVWQEFYAANQQQRSVAPVRQPGQPQSPPTTSANEANYLPDTDPVSKPKEQATSEAPTRYQPPRPYTIVSNHEIPSKTRKRRRSPSRKLHPAATASRQTALHKAKSKLVSRIRERSAAHAKAAEGLKSLLVGLGFGALAIVIVLFGFFNEVVIARLIQPSGGSAETPIILSTDGVAPSDKSEVIIPKINVQLPLVFDVPSASENVIQDALDDGVIHYPGTSLPGQKGNAAYFGHSSNNIFNSGKYKFAFVLLKELVPGDIFYVTHKGKAYTYRVYDKRIVDPSETWVLGNAPGKVATAALITCDPPGTTINRLVVWGEQITPDPTTNTSATAPEPAAPELPAQGPTLWGRFWNWITGG